MAKPAHNIGFPVQLTEWDKAEPRIMYRVVDGYANDTPRVLRFFKLRDTPKGCWIVDLDLIQYGRKNINIEEHKRFVLNNSYKRFAHDSLGAAFESYRLRKEYHIFHLSRRIRAIKEQQKNIMNAYIQAFTVQKARIEYKADELTRRLV